MIELSIVTPCYNEEEIIADTIRNNISVLDKYNVCYEQIVVNDASSDNSLQRIYEVSELNKKIKVFTNATNMGFGGAIRRGIELSTMPNILCIPADNPLDEVTLDELLKEIHNADVIVGYRSKRLGYSRFMLFNSYCYHWLISNLFKLKLKDYNWVHMYKKYIFDQGKVSIQYDGIFMLAEVLIKASYSGFKIKEVKIDQKQRITGVASASKLINILRTGADVFRFYIQLKLSHLLFHIKKIINLTDNEH